MLLLFLEYMFIYILHYHKNMIALSVVIFLKQVSEFSRETLCFVESQKFKSYTKKSFISKHN